MQSFVRSMEFWRERAACMRLSLEEREQFFGEQEGVPVQRQHERARTICYQCESQVACLQYAIMMEAEAGVWGGLTPSQRKRYLMPELRRWGHDDRVYVKVILSRGSQIVKAIRDRGGVVALHQRLPV